MAISRVMLMYGRWPFHLFLDFSHFKILVAGYWLNSISQCIFDHNNVAARSVSALAKALTACLRLRINMQLSLNKNQALTATLVFVLTSMVYVTCTHANSDYVFTFWIIFFGKARPRQERRIHQNYVVWRACGGVFLTKGFLAFIILLIALVSWALIFVRMKFLLFSSPLILSCVIVAAQS